MSAAATPTRWPLTENGAAMVTPINPYRGEDFGIGDHDRAGPLGPAIPEPRARIVVRGLLGAAEFLLAVIEVDIMIEGRRSLFRHDPAIGVLRALRRQLALDHRRRVDAPRLPKGAVAQADIDGDDLLAVTEDAVEVSQAAVVGVEAGILLADRGGGADQGFERIEIVLDVLEGIYAEALDQLLGVGPGDVVVGKIVDRDDREKNRDGEKSECRQDAWLEPRIDPEDASHGPAVLEVAR